MEEKIMTEDEEEYPTITLNDLLEYQKLHDRIDDFVRDKLSEYENAEKNNPKYHSTYSGGDYLIELEIEENKLTVKYYSQFSDKYYDTYTLPLDILFDDDFYEKAKAIFDEERKIKAEKEKERELKILEELKKKYEAQK
jgi:hypothetical protein